jgi:cell division inhibitor SepF
MSTLFSKALVYLGLVDEDQTEVEVDHRETGPSNAAEDPRKVRPLTPPEGRRIEPPAATSRTAAPMAASMGSPMGSGDPRLHHGGNVRTTSAPATQMRALRSEPQANILVVEEFGDAKILADWIRDGIPVVMDLRRTDTELMRRVVDFSSGLIYALDGRMRKVGDSLVLITPDGGELAMEEKRRLQALGAYEIPLED